MCVIVPPEDLSVSALEVNVTEYQIPDRVTCRGRGRPKLSYVWKRNSTSEPITKVDTLQLDKMSRSQAGNYTCEAYNKYGNQTINVYFNVQCKYWLREMVRFIFRFIFLDKPSCSIEFGEHRGNRALICTATANPEDISFVWRVREFNDTIDEIIVNEGIKSFLVLDNSVDTLRHYQCIARNSIGVSNECEQSVAGEQFSYGS